MEKLWHDLAWNQYLEWQGVDRRTLKRINALITSIERNGYDCIGKPEPLKYRKGWSRRIDQVNRLVYDIDQLGNLWIISCKGHYEE